MLLGNRTDVLVVVRVFKTGLKGVVVNIGNRAFGLDLVDSHGLKLQVRHGTRSVLGQGLIDFQTDLLALHHFPIDQMCFQNFFCNRHSHCLASLLMMIRAANPCRSFPLCDGFHSLLHGVVPCPNCKKTAFETKPFLF